MGLEGQILKRAQEFKYLGVSLFFKTAINGYSYIKALKISILMTYDEY